MQLANGSAADASRPSPQLRVGEEHSRGWAVAVGVPNRSRHERDAAQGSQTERHVPAPPEIVPIPRAHLAYVEDLAVPKIPLRKQLVLLHALGASEERVLLSQLHRRLEGDRVERGPGTAAVPAPRERRL